jgi:hypothetical protein
VRPSSFEARLRPTARFALCAPVVAFEPTVLSAIAAPSTTTAAIAAVVRPWRLATRSGPPRAPRAQLGILHEDPALQLAKLRPGLEPQVLDQARAPGAKSGQRVGLAAGPVERKHELPERALAERVLSHERLQLGHEGTVAPERQLGVDPLLDGEQPPLLEPFGLASGEPQVCEVGERGSAPERERGSQRSLRGLGVAARERLVPLFEQPLEPVRVKLAGVHLQDVSRRAAREAPVAEQLAQARDVVVQRVVDGRRRPLAPQAVDHPVARHHLVGPQHEHGQQRALLGSAQRELAAVPPHDQRTQDTEIHLMTQSRSARQRTAHPGIPRS